MTVEDDGERGSVSIVRLRRKTAEKYWFPRQSVKVGQFFFEKSFFLQNCVFDSVGEERDQTDRHRRTHTH